jgi:hypothetical protein
VAQRGARSTARSVVDARLSSSIENDAISAMDEIIL